MTECKHVNQHVIKKNNTVVLQHCVTCKKVLYKWNLYTDENLTPGECDSVSTCSVCKAQKEKDS